MMYSHDTIPLCIVVCTTYKHIPYNVNIALAIADSDNEPAQAGNNTFTSIRHNNNVYRLVVK